MAARTTDVESYNRGLEMAAEVIEANVDFYGEKTTTELARSVRRMKIPSARSGPPAEAPAATKGGSDG